MFNVLLPLSLVRNWMSLYSTYPYMSIQAQALLFQFMLCCIFLPHTIVCLHLLDTFLMDTGGLLIGPTKASFPSRLSSGPSASSHTVSPLLSDQLGDLCCISWSLSMTSFHLGDPKMYAVFSAWFNKCWLDGDNPFSQSAGYAIGQECCWPSLLPLTFSSLSTKRTFSSFLAKPLPQSVKPQSVSLFFLTMGMILPLCLLNSITFLSAYFLSWCRSPWMAAFHSRVINSSPSHGPLILKLRCSSWSRYERRVMCIFTETRSLKSLYHPLSF